MSSNFTVQHVIVYESTKDEDAEEKLLEVIPFQILTVVSSLHDAKLN
jgi:hypothetical protein